MKIIVPDISRELQLKTTMNKIIVQREILMSGVGMLSYFKNGTRIIHTKTWEHAGNLIPPKVYNGCSKTQMSTSGRTAIYMPDEQTGKVGIFIHSGVSQSNSEGCICIHPNQMENLLSETPSQNGSITIEIINP